MNFHFKRKLNKTKTLLLCTHVQKHKDHFFGYLLPTVELCYSKDVFVLDFMFWTFTFEIWVGPDEFAYGPDGD